MRRVQANPAQSRALCGLCVGLGLLLLSFAASAAPRGPDPRVLHLRAGRFDPLREAPPLRGFAAAHPGGGRSAYLVQFTEPIDHADREALLEAGARIGGYVPMYALEVLMTGSQRAAVEKLPGVRWVGPYEVAWKLSPGLLLGDGAERFAARREWLALRVSLFGGAGDEGIGQLRGLGAHILRQQGARSFSVVDLEIPPRRLRALAELPLVRFVQRLPTPVFHNDRARFISGLTQIADDDFATGLDPSLDGRDEVSGFQVKYGHTDTGLWPDHPDFANGILQGWIDFEPGANMVDSDGHGTHTAGSLIGDGLSSTDVAQLPPGTASVAVGRFRGVQPQAALHHISMANGYSDREIFERQSEEGAQILTNSWGYADCTGCDAITDYEASAALWDEGVWDADDDVEGLQPVVVFFAAGNGALEQLNGCPLFGEGDEISSPGTAKNVITVGANETDRGCGFAGEADHPGDVLFVSSRGPVDPDASGQGLFKPDVTAVGGAFVLSTEREGSGGVAGGFDDPSYCSDTGTVYRYEGGTSMSCPIAAGAGGVLFQDLVVKRGVAAPKPSLIKALLINGALAIEPSGPCDYSFETDAPEVDRGWGMVQAPASLYGPQGSPELRDVDFENEVSDHALATGETHQVQVEVAAGAPFKVTLVWTDFPAAPEAGSPLVVNDLDLEVSGPEGTFLGNNFVGDWSVPDTESATPDRYNVVENVYIENPIGGTYTLSVRGFQVSQDQEPERGGVNQDFSLVWTTPSLDIALPEPGGPALLGAGIVFLAALGRRRIRT